MKKIRSFWRAHRLLIVYGCLAAAGLVWLLLNRLGTMTSGLSSDEFRVASTPVGWHGIYHQPLDLPLKLVRSAVFFLAPNHGNLLTRLPNALFGAGAIISFAWLIRVWHGQRTTILATLLFATGAWTLHASRLASFDVIYLWATPTLLLTQFGLQQRSHRRPVWFASLITLGLMLYIPGLVWLILLNLYLQRLALRRGWQQLSIRWKGLSLVLVLLAVVPLVLDLLRPGQLLQWLGLPSHLASLSTLAKNFGGVFGHLFIRGPQYPNLWLGKAPLLDIFTLVVCLLGIYFYASHWKSRRSRLLGLTGAIGVILVALGGPVGLSLLVPLLYMAAATGLAYLLHDWLKVFPINPLARSLGIGLILLAIAGSCFYNLRAYFVAWPHNSVTEATFHYQRP